MEAKAAIANGTGGFTLEAIEVAAPLGDEVLIETKAAGLCHTDHASLSWGRPLVMGHEGAGIVRAIGPAVSHLRPGERVVLNWVVPCGRCFQCKRGDEVLCEESKPAHVMERSSAHAHAAGTTWRGTPVDRSFNLGTLCSIILVRAAAVTVLPAEVSFTSGCIVGCGVMTGFGSVVNVAKVPVDSSVAVLGCGGVGLNIIQAARLSGASLIIALDTQQGRLEQARRFGATHSIRCGAGSGGFQAAVRELREITHGRGADFAFEATAVPSLAFAPLELVRDGGSAFQVSGCNETVTAAMQSFMWNKTYMTPLYGGCVPARDFSRIFGHYQRGDLMLDELVTRKYHLEELSAALEDMLEGRNAKGVVVFD